MKSARLGETLVHLGHCTRQQLILGLREQVLYGDRLGTNLLTLGFIHEEQLANALGHQHQVRAGHHGNINIQLDVLKYFPSATCRGLQVLPHHLGPEGLFVLTTNPQQMPLLQEYAEQYKVKFVPVVVTEARMWSLLTEYAGSPSRPRVVPLGPPTQQEDVLAWSSSDPHRDTNDDELISEADFAALYMKVDEPEPVEQGWSSPTEEGPAEESVERTLDLIIVDAERSGEFAIPKDVPAEVDLEPIGRLSAAREPITLPAGPIAVDEACTLLNLAQGRNEIAEIVVQSALSHYKRVVLLTVLPTTVIGWKARGQDLTDAHIEGFKTPRAGRAVFCQVAASKTPFTGPLARITEHASWVKKTERKIPKSITVIPVVVGGRVVNVLYVDDGHDQSVSPGVAPLVPLVTAMERALAKLF